MEGQDWNPVVMRKHKPGGGAAKATPVNVNAVRGPRDARPARSHARGCEGRGPAGRPRLARG